MNMYVCMYVRKLQRLYLGRLSCVFEERRKGGNVERGKGEKESEDEEKKNQKKKKKKGKGL